jgi:hypothetical protein
MNCDRIRVIDNSVFAGVDTAGLLLLLFVLCSMPSSASGSNFDGPAELPRIIMQTTMSSTPSPGKVIFVAAGGSFQAALNSASCGDTIQLQAGAVFSGAVTLPAKPCDNNHWITIRTSASNSSLPAEGSRISPCYAGVTSLPGRPSFACSAPRKVLATLMYVPGNLTPGPVFLAPGANHYRLLGLEITRPTGAFSVGNLISVRGPGTADHIIVDRSWLHGTTHDETRGGVGLSGTTYFAVVDSYFTDFHCTAVSGACTDAHAMAGGVGAFPGGPYRILNNFLEASGENIMFGGGAATTVPSDIEVRRNHFFKPLQWMPGRAGFVGATNGNPFVVKNHFELKNAQRVLLEGNIFENTWGGFSQAGYSILFTPKNQWDPKSKMNICPACEVTDVVLRYSTISHAGAGIQMATGLSDGGGAALAGARFSIHDITIDDINARTYTGTGTLMQIANNWRNNVLNSITINHITAFPDPAGHMLSIGNQTNNQQMSNFNFTNNLVSTSIYPVWSTGGGSGNCAFSDNPILVMPSCFRGFSFSHNALIGAPASYPASKWPAGNSFPSSATAVQFVNYQSGNGGDYHLLASSPYNNAASDGKDIGADMNALQSAISGVY